MFHFEKYNEKDEKKWDDFVMEKWNFFTDKKIS